MADHRTSRGMAHDAGSGNHPEQATYGELSPPATSVPSPQRESEPRFLADASQQLAASLDYEDTLVAVAGMALPYLGSWCIVDVVEQDGSMRRLGISHPDPRKAEHARRLKDGWPPDRDDPIGLPRVIRSRATELVATVTDAMLVDVANSEVNLQDLRALGIGSVVIVPLIARGRVLGAITFVSADVGHQYTDRDVELAEDLAARCAIALDNARLFRDLEAVRKDAARLNEALVLSSIRQQELADEARDANAAKSRFLATMSHEIRTPLNAIVGYTDLLETGIAGPLTARQVEYLARLKAGSRHLIGLIDDILDLAKVESGRMVLDRAPFAADDSISAAIALVEPQAGSAEVAITSECARETSKYVGDEERVRQILVILLSNAVKFTARGGSITVTCGATRAPDAEAALQGNGPWTFIRVTDTGIGIPATEAETIFQPFVQVDSGSTRRRGGTGLGLAIGRDLARRMGGDLTLRSAPGEGSCFTLWLPGLEMIVPRN
ncbi:MAG TPA: ATP-binding protein [Longimicrobiales bacterium]|nr:ATP-binding protein [Longimicrobiales bacterium]